MYSGVMKVLGNRDRVDVFKSEFMKIQGAIHHTAKVKGFWGRGAAEDPAAPVHGNFGEKIALAHSELSEALEAHREGDKPSEKIPNYTCIEEEFADVIVRLLDTGAAYGYDIVGALLAKMDYNLTRPPKHGKEY